MTIRSAGIVFAWGAVMAVAGPATEAGAFSRMADPCPMRVQSFDATASFADPADFRAGAVLFYTAVGEDELQQALTGVAPGAARDVSERFRSSDSRWRLIRHLDLPAQPDALVELPAQAQYLVQPRPDAVYSSLILVGLPKEGGLALPALAGRYSAQAGDRAGQLFTIESGTGKSVTGSDRCLLAPTAAADRVQNILRDDLKRKN